MRWTGTHFVVLGSPSGYPTFIFSWCPLLIGILCCNLYVVREKKPSEKRRAGFLLVVVLFSPFWFCSFLPPSFPFFFFEPWPLLFGVAALFRTQQDQIPPAANGSLVLRRDPLTVTDALVWWSPRRLGTDF